MTEETKELQYLTYKLFYNRDGKRLLELLKRYLSRQTVLPAESATLAKFGHDIKAFLAFHQGKNNILIEIENLSEGYANHIQQENREG